MNHPKFRTRSRTVLAAAAALALGACSPGAGDGPALNTAVDPSQTVFLTQASPPDAFMEALFEGRVYRDAQGCLRLESLGGDHPTAIWPYGFTLQGRDGELHVRDAKGRSIGRIGGAFRFGGGMGSTLRQGVVSAQQHQAAESRCPGSYWIVGETDLRS